MSRAKSSLPDRRLHIADLACARGERDVLASISFDLASGHALLLRGANGAGKSTLLMCLAGLLPFDGRIAIDGRGENDRPGADIHFVSHLPALKPGLSVRANLAFWTELNAGDPGLVPKALDEARLAHAAEFEAAILSAGQTRRLSLCRLLTAPRSIWLLDEPTAALDRDGTAWIGRLIDAHLEAGGLAVIATHDDLPLTHDVQTLEIGAIP